MRSRAVLVFAAGFFSGVVCLALLQHESGLMPGMRAARAAALKPPPREPLPLVARKNLPDEPLVERRLIIPVLGVKPGSLMDTFNQGRTGHIHEALDIMAPRGTPVLAADQGRVEKLFTSKPGGLTVYQFDGSGAYCYYYAHLDGYAPGLKEGQLLHQGDVLGFVGSTGNASPAAPHLHFAIFRLGPEKHWWQGTPIDPYTLLAGSAGE